MAGRRRPRAHPALFVHALEMPVDTAQVLEGLVLGHETVHEVESRLETVPVGSQVEDLAGGEVEERIAA